MKDQLRVIATEGTQEEKSDSRRMSRREVVLAKFERLWLTDPEQFNPLRNVKERERLSRTQELLDRHLKLNGKKIVDLGCGSGVLTERFAVQAAKVEAVDIANNALKLLAAKSIPNIAAIQDYVPQTKLKDEAYDLVVSTELISLLPVDQYRLYFSELARLMSPEGMVLCSTSVDIYSEDALQRFILLAETEFKISDWILSYHALYIRLSDFFKAPARFVKAWRDSEYRQRELANRQGLNKKWFKFNTNPVVAPLWIPFYYLFKPFLYVLRKNRPILLWLESVSRFIWDESGVSHIVFVGTRRALIVPPVEENIPVERKQRKQVWE